MHLLQADDLRLALLHDARETEQGGEVRVVVLHAGNSWLELPALLPAWHLRDALAPKAKALEGLTFIIILFRMFILPTSAAIIPRQ